MDGQAEYRGYIIRQCQIPAGGETPGAARDFWIISERTDADMEVLAGLAPSLENAKRQVDGLLE